MNYNIQSKSLKCKDYFPLLVDNFLKPFRNDSMKMFLSSQLPQQHQCNNNLTLQAMHIRFYSLIAYVISFFVFTRLFFQYSKMKMLFFLLLIVTALSVKDPHHPFLLIFTSEGTYYKLQISSKHVEWYNTLGSNLLSFELIDSKETKQENSYILPTLDGHFLYIDAHTEILIDRKQVQQLLNVCFESQVQQTNIDEPARYFIYEKYEYYIINLNNGHAQDLESFLKTGFPSNLDKMAVLKVSKKFLKQLKKDLSIAWSTISSEIDVIPAEKFIKNPKASSKENQVFVDNSELKFRRVENNEIELNTKNQNFQIGGSSHIIGIFQFIDQEIGYLQHPMEYHYRPKLAIQYISHRQSSQLSQFSSSKPHGQFNFIHSAQAKQRISKQGHKQLQFCINSFRNLKALTDQSRNFNKKGQIKQLDVRKIQKQLENQSIVYKTIQITPKQDYVIHYGPTQDQPYVWIAFFVTVFVFVYWFHKMKINSLLSKFSAMESQTDKKFEQFQQKLNKFEELKKMYEVYWDKIAYRVCGDQWYEHIVYEGKFLNQSTFVYAIRQEGTDIVSLQHKLNILLNFSHKGLAKLYYYTKNAEYLLIFTEKMPLLSNQKLPNFMEFEFSNNSKKAIITEIIEAVAYLDSKIEINCLPYEAVCFEKKKQSQSQTSLAFKLNSIPCLLKRSSDDSQLEESRSWSSDNNTVDLRLNMAAIFHLLIHKGEKYNKQYIDELLKNEAYSQDQYLQFFDFLLYEAKSKAEASDKDGENDVPENMRGQMFKDILDHPFLWDSKRKIMFLSDFSNYIETHIDEAKVKKLESHAKDYNVIKTPWIKEFHFLFARQISNYRKYDFESVRDLIRVIRNKLNHFHEIPREVRSHIGHTPEGFIEYCLEQFPKLLHFAFVYTQKKKWKLHMK